MKKVLLIAWAINILTSCSKTDENENYKIEEGIYAGYYSYNNNQFWSSIDFENDNYEEYASGGVAFQKDFECLTKGSYEVKGVDLIFVKDSYLFNKDQVANCNSELILSGSFRINFINSDSISFEKGTGENRIVYFLRKYYSN